MPTESDLRDLFRGPDGDGSQLDAGEIIRRAHHRRTPKVVAATAGALLVVAAVVVPVATLGLERGGSTVAGAGSSSSSPDLGRTGGRSDGLKAPAAPLRQSACAAPSPAPSDASLGASVDALDAEVGDPVSGALVLRGSAATSEVRVTGPVALTLLRGDAVVWSGSTDLGSPRLSLSAGGEARLPFTVRVSDCDSGAVLPAGEYRIVASVPVAVDGASAQRVRGDGTLRIG